MYDPHVLLSIRARYPLLEVEFIITTPKGIEAVKPKSIKKFPAKKSSFTQCRKLCFELVTAGPRAYAQQLRAYAQAKRGQGQNLGAGTQGDRGKQAAEQCIMGCYKDSNKAYEFERVEDSLEEENEDYEFERVEDSLEEENEDCEFERVEDSLEEENEDYEFEIVEDSLEEENEDCELERVEDSLEFEKIGEEEDENNELERVEDSMDLEGVAYEEDERNYDLERVEDSLDFERVEDGEDEDLEMVEQDLEAVADEEGGGNELQPDFEEIVVGSSRGEARGITHIGYTTLVPPLPHCTRDTRPDHLCQEDFRYKEPVEPFVEPSALIPLLGHHEGAARGIIHIGFKNNSTTMWDLTLTLATTVAGEGNGGNELELDFERVVEEDEGLEEKEKREVVKAMLRIYLPEFY
ncbi:hypothetical protein TSUD_99010 [Trifolium subterraneum]|uniref:Uncharacterized protein n=1 Tax=Trifolium subterraneum TaxID=3900 RepID=A0A2Z6P0F1_TRISU|nr:hypothetical protein TSUD_99010 [Trifolium subterraneum]